MTPTPSEPSTHRVTTGRVFFTHCALRLGDNLAHLHFLRALAKARPADQFYHFAHQNQLGQLIEVVCDLPNLHLKDLETVADPAEQDHWKMRPLASLGSVDAWKNADAAWETHIERSNYAPFMLDHFARLAERMQAGASPFKKPADLLFDYPGLLRYNAEPFDVLIVNSPPQSGQLKAFSFEHGAQLAIQLQAARKKVITTYPVKGVPCTQFNLMSVTAVGSLSRFACVVCGVATGPMWPCLNVYNANRWEAKRILICDEDVNLVAGDVTVRNFYDAQKQLAILGFL